MNYQAASSTKNLHCPCSVDIPAAQNSLPASNPFRLVNEAIVRKAKPCPTDAIKTSTVMSPTSTANGPVTGTVATPAGEVIPKPAGWEFTPVSVTAMAIALGVVAVGIGRGRLIEAIALGLYGASLSATRTREYLAEVRVDRERKQYICMTQKRFDGHLAELMRLAEAEKRAGEILLGIAGRLSPGSRLADTLQKRGARRMKIHRDLLAEYARLIVMRDDIDLNREVLAHKRRRRLILQMMTQLDMLYEATARAALAKLNEFASTFEWETLPPVQLPTNVRLQLTKFLRLMASTNFLEEARAAKAQFERLLSKHRFSFADIGI